MRLLNATTRQLREFVAEDEIPPYAILSHTWGKAEDEAKLQDLADRGVKGKAGYLKIDYCCKQALEDNLEWVWVDTCCIDKSSTAELSEAINSMFRWYQNSKVCYVYLDDVRLRSSDGESFFSSFRRSRWFTRGWTLQELIAPQALVFFNRDWTVLGTKKDMALSSDILSSITRIDKKFLLSTDRFWYLRDDGPCIAKIMSWAADRKTTRIEDRAYCLLGLFDINMPLLYGEGKKSFFRLEEELIKCSSDPSLFAWGGPPTIQQLDVNSNLDDSFKDIYDIWEIDQGTISTTGLLARSPDDFRYSGKIRRLSLAPIGSNISTTPTATVNRGVRVDMFCFSAQMLLTSIIEQTKIASGTDFAGKHSRISHGVPGPVMGLLPCTLHGDGIRFLKGDNIRMLLIPLFALDEPTSRLRAGYQLFGRYKAKPLIFFHPKVLQGLNSDPKKNLHVDSHWISDWCESSST